MDFMQSLTLESATEKDARPLPRLMPRLHVKAFSGGAIVLIFILSPFAGPSVSGFKAKLIPDLRIVTSWEKLAP